MSNLLLPAGLRGCQTGLAIFIQSGQAGTANVLVEKSVVENYQKNGITGNEADTTVTFQNNQAVGCGPVPYGEAAQNGIQVGFGATGNVQFNTVLHHIYTGYTTDQYQASGILTFDVVANVHDNTIQNNQMSIGHVGSNGLIKFNKVVGPGKPDTPLDHTGVYVYGDNNVIERNRFFTDEFGIWVDVGSLNNQLLRNRFSDVRNPDPGRRNRDDHQAHAPDTESGPLGRGEGRPTTDAAKGVSSSL